jgi:hypothetical protein
MVYRSARAYLSEPRLALDAHGETIVAWTESGPHGAQRAKALILGPSGRPEGRVQTLSPPGAGIAELSLAANARGDAVLLWREKGRVSRPIQVSTRTFDRSFSRPVTISRAEESEATAAVEPGGETTILFTHILSSTPGEFRADPPTLTTRVEVVTGSADARWTRPRPLVSSSGQSTYEPRLAAAPDGNELFALWTAQRIRSVRQGSEPLPSPGSINASLRTADGGWQAPVVLSGGSSGLPLITFGTGGEATAAWVNQVEQPGPVNVGGVVTTTLESARYVPAG